jgi:hypothetical protein
MDRETALRLQLTIQLHALAGALRRGETDPRRLWSLADLALDSHDQAGMEHPALRGEVVALMRAIAARRGIDAGSVAGRLELLADGIPQPPRHRDLALAG